MRFLAGDKTYAIEFRREHREVKYFEGQEEKVRPSKFPYTICKIVEVDPDLPSAKWKVFREHTVGCRHNQVFKAEEGRLWGLRAISRTVTKDFRKAMWHAYLNRKAPIKHKVVEKVTVH